MPKPKSEAATTASEPGAKGQTNQAFLRAEVTQLALQIRKLNGNKHTWPYAHLSYHVLEGGQLRIYFSAHVLIIRGRHLEGADQGLCLQSLVFLQENGTRRREALGESDIPEDQPAIDSIQIYDRER